LIKSFEADISKLGSIAVVAVAMVFLLAEANWVRESLYPLPHGRNNSILPITSLVFSCLFWSAAARRRFHGCGLVRQVMIIYRGYPTLALSGWALTF